MYKISDCRDNNLDFCPQCGLTAPAELWGATCPNDHKAVHIGNCSYCENPVGFIIDDDYGGPDTLVCTNCLLVAEALNEPSY